MSPWHIKLLASRNESHTTGESTLPYLERLATEVQAGRPAALAKVVDAPRGSGIPAGAALLVGPAGLLAGRLPDAAVQSSLVELSFAMLAKGRSGALRVAAPSGPLRVYVEVHLPTPTLVVVGAGHVGQLIAQVGALAGFRVVVVDDRPGFANSGRFPTAHQVICSPFDQALKELGLGEQHYVVLVTRGHHQDMRCLQQVIHQPVAYLGMIGSRPRIQTVFQLLEEEGIPPESLGRVRAPIGLDIGARNPGEIAVAVLAEIIAHRYSGTCAPLSTLPRSLVHQDRGQAVTEEPLIATLMAARTAREPVALATVIHTRGHTPREVGAKMIVWRDGRIAGTIGGGCGENRVRMAALTALDMGAPSILEVNLLDDPALEDGAVCGGVMEVLIEPHSSAADAG